MMLNRLAAFVAALLTFVLVAACGTTAHPKTVKLPPSVVKACPEALHGQGAMGGCAPHEPAKPKLTRAKASSASSGGITYPDRSNNDPTYNMAAIKRAGHPAIMLKVNQGVGFLDSTFYYAAKAAQRAGLVVGGYDVDQEYTAREVYKLIERLHAAGIYRGTPRTFPPTLDVELGAASRAGLEHQLAVLFRVYGRAQVYTGGWYWLPHFGCWVPAHVAFWLSGYPVAALLCGLAEASFVAHQYTDHGYDGVGFTDMTVWRGSSASFAAFVQAEPRPTPAQDRASKRRSLHKHEALERELHSNIERHRCRPGQHVIPRRPLHTRRRLHNVLCPRWNHRDAQTRAVIARYHREGVR